MNEWTCELRRKEEFGATAKHPPAKCPRPDNCSLFLGRRARCPEPLRLLVLQLRGVSCWAELGLTAKRLLCNSSGPNATLPCQKGPLGGGWRRRAVRALLRLRWERPLGRGTMPENTLPPSAATAYASVPLSHSFTRSQRCPCIHRPFQLSSVFLECSPLTQEPALAEPSKISTLKLYLI